MALADAVTAVAMVAVMDAAPPPAIGADADAQTPATTADAANHCTFSVN